MAVPISADDKRWQAEGDARTLAEAEQIKQDEKRLAEAQTAAKRMADEEAERLKAMRKVAGQKGKGTDAAKPAGKETGGAKKQGTGSGGSKHNVFKRI